MRDNKEVREMMQEAKRLRDEWETYLLEMKDYNRCLKDLKSLSSLNKVKEWLMECLYSL